MHTETVASLSKNCLRSAVETVHAIMHHALCELQGSKSDSEKGRTVYICSTAPLRVTSLYSLYILW